MRSAAPPTALAALAALATLVAAAGSPAPARAGDVPDPGEAIAAGIISAQPQLQRCWEKAAADDFRLAGDVVLRVTFGKGGKARKVVVASDTTKDPVLTKCVAALARGWTWGEAVAGQTIEVPLSFVAPAAQYAIAAEDAPARRLARGVEARILVDAQNAAAEKASMALVKLAKKAQVELPRSEVALVWVVAGDGRVTSNGTPTTLARGDAVYLPRGADARFVAGAKGLELLVLYAPGGPEKAWKGRQTTAAAAAASRDPRPSAQIARPGERRTYPIAGGKGQVTILFDRELTGGDASAYVGWVVAQPGVEVPEHVHPGEAELLYFLAGEGIMTVAGEPMAVQPGMAIHVPPGTKHGFKVTSGTAVEAVQFYAPAGPEQRFKGQTAPQPTAPER